MIPHSLHSKNYFWSYDQKYHKFSYYFLYISAASIANISIWQKLTYRFLRTNSSYNIEMFWFINTVTGCGIDELPLQLGSLAIAYLFTLISQTRVLRTKYQNTHKYLNLNQTKLIYSKVYNMHVWIQHTSHQQQSFNEYHSASMKYNYIHKIINCMFHKLLSL